MSKKRSQFPRSRSTFNKQKRKNKNGNQKLQRKERKFPIKEWEKAKGKERKFPTKEWEKVKKEGKKVLDQRNQKKCAERSFDQTISEQYRIVTK